MKNKLITKNNKFSIINLALILLAIGFLSGCAIGDGEIDPCLNNTNTTASPANKAELKAIIYPAIASNQTTNLNYICTSNIKDMGALFANKVYFNGDISEWDTGKVTTMEYMFDKAFAFNQNISNWNTSKVTTMESMFRQATSFNGNITNWDTSKVTNMESMFANASTFNGNITNWDTSQVTTMDHMFRYATAFNQNLSKWNVNKVTSYEGFATAAHADFKDNTAKHPSWK